MKQQILFILSLSLLVACGGDNNYYQDFSEVRERDSGMGKFDAFSGSGEFERTKLGSLVLITNNDLVQGRPATNPITLLDENLNDYPSMRERVLEPGTWVVTLATEITVPDPAFPGINPLVAKVTYGSGGVSASFVVSCSPGATFQVSADRVRVDIILEDLLNVPVPGDNVPLEQRVTGFLRRGTIVSYPSRSFYVATLAPATSLGIIPLPPLAIDVFAHSLPTSGLYAADTLLDILAGTTVIQRYTGAELRASILGGSALPIPLGATDWRLTSGAAGIGATGTTIEFGIDI